VKTFFLVYFHSLALFELAPTWSNLILRILLQITGTYCVSRKLHIYSIPNSIKGSIMRIYVESSVEKNLTFLKSKISKKVKEQKDFSTLLFRRKWPQLFKSDVFLPMFDQLTLWVYSRYQTFLKRGISKKVKGQSDFC
jgi:hypothetical protein